jgi:hypothetical protein
MVRMRGRARPRRERPIFLPRSPPFHHPGQSPGRPPAGPRPPPGAPGRGAPSISSDNLSSDRSTRGAIRGKQDRWFRDRMGLISLAPRGTANDGEIDDGRRYDQASD